MAELKMDFAKMAEVFTKTAKEKGMFVGWWIPVSERLPEENEYIGDVCKYYLIQDEYGDMHVAHLSNVGWIPMDSLKAIGNEVIAWMPLPQPYKGESEYKCKNCKYYRNPDYTRCHECEAEREDKE